MGTQMCHVHLAEMELFKQICQVFQALLAGQQPQLLAVIPG